MSTTALDTKAMGYKIIDTYWWFLPGFLYRSLGVIGCGLLGAGLYRYFAQFRNLTWRTPSRQTRLFCALGAFLVALIVVASGYFQNARKLMPFFPVMAILICLGADQLCLLAKKINVIREMPGQWSVLVVCLALLLIQGITYGPTCYDVFVCRRDAGYMREYLEEHDIKKILTSPQYVAYPMAPDQVALCKANAESTEGYEYIVLHRLYGGSHGKKIFDKLKDVKPVVSFPNQVALPLFWYEFPLKKEFMDQDDPLTTSRGLLPGGRCKKRRWVAAGARCPKRPCRKN